MHLNVDSQTVVVFDLDDTLYKEIDFVRSAFMHISAEIDLEVHDEMWRLFRQGENVFRSLIDSRSLPLEVSELVEMYRYHLPSISLSNGARKLLDMLKMCDATLGIITDGRERTQMNKLRALEIDGEFEKVVISETLGSEKPSERNYLVFEEDFPDHTYVYVGDNFRKDFVTPNRRGWQTIGLIDDGRNIHSQASDFPSDHLPNHTVRCLTEIKVVCGGQ